MNAGSLFNFLGLVAFLWAAFFTMAAEGFLFGALSPAMLLLVAFFAALVVFWLSTLSLFTRRA